MAGLPRLDGEPGISLKSRAPFPAPGVPTESDGSHLLFETRQPSVYPQIVEGRRSQVQVSDSMAATVLRHSKGSQRSWTEAVEPVVMAEIEEVGDARIQLEYHRPGDHLTTQIAHEQPHPIRRQVKDPLQGCEGGRRPGTRLCAVAFENSIEGRKVLRTGNRHSDALVQGRSNVVPPALVDELRGNVLRR